MKSFKPLGLVGMNENGVFVYIPIQAEQSLIVNPHSDTVEVINEDQNMDDTGISHSPTPEQDRIDKEVELPIHSLTDVLNKNKPKENG